MADEFNFSDQSNRPPTTSKQPPKRWAPPPWLKATGFGILGIAFLGWVFGFWSVHGRRISVNGGEVFYTPSVTKAEAEKLGRFLVRTRMFDGQHASAQLDKQDGVYLVRIVFEQWAFTDVRAEVDASLLRKQLAREVFLNGPVAVHMCDPNLKTIKTIGPNY